MPLDDPNKDRTPVEDNFPPDSADEVEVIDTDSDIENVGGDHPDLIDQAAEDAEEGEPDGSQP